ncbi:MAG: hypothetical protein M3R15_15620 [Acidobacteriota bacterium]|nr:hypothetical protein [Acidobacteriota bacterium]
MSVKPEMITDFQNFMTSETNPALRKGGMKSRDVWRRTAAAGDPFEFIIVAPMDNFAQYDGQTPLEKALGKEGYAAWEAKAGRFVNSVRRYVIRTRPDLSHQGKRTGTPKLAVVSFIHVAPGRNQDFVNHTMNNYMPVFKQAGATYLVAETMFGDDVNEFITLTMRESFADIDKGPIPVQVLGADGARQLNHKLPTGVITRIKRSFVRYVPELSIMPAEASSK